MRMRLSSSEAGSYLALVLRAPFFGQIAPEGGGQDGLTELFQQVGDGFKGLSGAAAVGLKFFDLGYDAFLFVEWERYLSLSCQLFLVWHG